jgi:hypothetical protein
MIFWNVIFDIGGYRKVSATGLMVAIVSFAVKAKGEHRNFALGKISPKGKFRSSPSPKIFT